MKLQEVLSKLAQVKDGYVITLSPGPFHIKVEAQDAVAATILQSLSQQLPADSTTRDAETALLYNLLEAIKEYVDENPEGHDWYTDKVAAVIAAFWWLFFWASWPTDEELAETEPVVLEA